MGVAGAAIATITSQLFSACMVVYALIHTDDMYKLVWSKVRIDERMLRRIVRIGIPLEVITDNTKNISPDLLNASPPKDKPNAGSVKAILYHRRSRRW